MAKISGGEAYVVGVVVGMVIGALLGGLIGWLLAQRHQSAAANEVGALREKVASADQARDAAQAMAEQRVRDLQETVERERAQHELALANLADRFRALADDTMKNVVQQFHVRFSSVFLSHLRISNSLEIFKDYSASTFKRIYNLFSNCLRQFVNKDRFHFLNDIHTCISFNVFNFSSRKS